MKKLKLTTFGLLLSLLVANYSQGQTITFTFANAEVTNDGADDYYEADVQISSDTDFKLGSGQIYFEYNTAAFGTNVSAGGNITYSYPNGTHILGEHENTGNADLYTSYVVNDNTDSRVSFSWQQLFSSEVYVGNNVTSTATNLFHVKIKFVDVAQDPMVCFPTNTVFHDQTYTACGSASSSPFTTADCTNYAGTQITNDNFDCAAAVVPVELLYFTGEAQEEDVLLEWETASEINNSHFEVERSTNGLEFIQIGIVEGSGTTIEQQYYDFLDENPVIGKNYYRLRQVDFDGNFEYTNVVVVEFHKEGVATNDIQINAFPNPTINVLNIKTENLDIEGYRIFNSIGQLVMEEQSLNSENLHQINVKTLASGTYFIQLNGSDERITFTKG